MKNTLLTLAATTIFAFSQGPLTPPGAPAPTMKSLDQVEPRIPVNATTCPGDTTYAFIIAQPGSYYLTGPITVASGSAIRISATNVTLDLNGFTIASTARSAAQINDGIQIDSQVEGAIIRNGHIVGQANVNTSSTPATFTPGGFTSGIYGGFNVTVQDITVRNCTNGIWLFSGSVERASLSEHVIYGIYYATTVTATKATTCGHIGISTKPDFTNNTGSVIDSWGEGRTGPGIRSTSVMNSHGISTGGAGIEAEKVSSSYGKSQSSTGISADNIDDSTGISVSGSGITGQLITNCRGTSESGSHGIRGNLVRGSEGRRTQSGGTGIYGIFADTSVYDSTGFANGGNTSVMGIRAGKLVVNSYGISQANGQNMWGIYADVVIGSYGEGNGVSVGGGIYAAKTSFNIHSN